MPEPSKPEPKVRQLRYPIWTENKAKLIERYLQFFVFITKHGVYIDAFAGPQEPDKHEMWAAKLVLESRPRWLRQFHLFELDRGKVEQLEQLAAEQPPRDKIKREPKRMVHIYAGDCNKNIAALLESRTLPSKEATFCLLDQRTFECKWATVAALAGYKPAGTKIELFYFLPNSWLDRALAAQKDTRVIEEWWGQEDWPQLRAMGSEKRLQALIERFRHELGYWSVKPWPIRERADGGRIMYYMVHATDHPAAPKLMDRAYRQAVQPIEPPEQLRIELGQLLGEQALIHADRSDPDDSSGE